MKVKSIALLTPANFTEEYQKKGKRGVNVEIDPPCVNRPSDEHLNEQERQLYTNPQQYINAWGQHHHQYWCVRDWLKNTTSILHDRLQTGYSKSGLVHLNGLLDWKLIKSYFEGQNCITKAQRVYPPREMKLQPYLKYRFEFKEHLPDMLFPYHIKEHSIIMRSRYVELHFSICTRTCRMTCYYQQISETKFGQTWIITA